MDKNISVMLSVVVPVYNVEKTLDRCVNSILKQGVDNMEIILVDDGSLDGSPALCDAWSKRNERIKVIHKSNGGLSDARNAGIEQARGEYVTFVDSDDYLEEGTYKGLLDWLEENKTCDILEYPLKHIGTDKRITSRCTDMQFASARHYWFATEAWEHAYAVNKIYRRTLFEYVRFPVGRVFEDIYTLPQLLCKNPHVATSSHGAYCYVWNEGGISALSSKNVVSTKQHLEALMLAAKTMETRLWSSNGYKIYLSMLYRQLDIYGMSGEIVLKWPLIRLVCWLHNKLR